MRVRLRVRLRSFIIIALARRPVESILTAARKEALKSLGFGVLGHILPPFAGLLLICLCITLPAGMIVMGAWMVLFYLAKLVVAAALADALLRRLGSTPSPYLALFLGMIPVWILCEIPVAGPLLYWFLVPMFGIGAILIGLKAWFRGNGGGSSAPAGAEGPSTPSQPPAASAGI